MNITRISHYRAKSGAEEALHGALLETVPVIANGNGCLRVRLLSSLDDPAEFVRLEEWASIDAHRIAAASLPADAIAKVSTLTIAPPRSGYYAG